MLAEIVRDASEREMIIKRLPIFFLFLSLSLSLFPGGCASSEKAPLSPAEPAYFQPEAKPSWQAEWDRTIVEASKESRLVAYGAYGLAQTSEPFVRALKESFGLELEMTIARGPELTAKLLSERRAGMYLADIYMGGATSIANELIPQKILEPIKPYFILPEVKEPAA